MSAAYSAAMRTAERLIGARGARVTFARAGAVDPITQAQSAAAVTYEAPMIASPLSPGRAALIFGSGANNALKERLSVQIALRGLSVTPQEGDGFTWGARAWRLASVTITNPDGTSPIVANAIAEQA